MVTYAQRVRLGVGTFGVASGAPALHGQSCASTVPGIGLPSGSAMPMVAQARVEAAAAGTVSTPNTIERDAFAGVSPGPRVTSPPV